MLLQTCFCKMKANEEDFRRKYKSKMKGAKAMKFGLLTAICEGMTFEEVVDFAAENNLECLEVACWPQGGAQRRYAGVSHIDVANLDEAKAAEINKLLWRFMQVFHTRLGMR